MRATADTAISDIAAANIVTGNIAAGNIATGNIAAGETCNWASLPDRSMLPESLSSTPRRLLIVEDHAQVRLVIVKALQAAGYDSAEAGDASEACRLVERMHFDAAVLDVSLPGPLNGIELGRWIRRQAPQVPLLFMTGLTEWDMPAAVPSGRRTGFLCKPFGARAMVESVRSLLSAE